MLNKSVCQQCINRFVARTGWTTHDEYRWKKGSVLCPQELRNSQHPSSVFTKIKLREYCPYFLEHLMSKKSNAK